MTDVVNSSNHKDLSELFHRLNNELGIILSHAELLEAKCAQNVDRSRASQVVAAALDAMGTARQIRSQVNDLTPAKQDRPPCQESGITDLQKELGNGSSR